MMTPQSCSEGHNSWNLLPAKGAAQELLSLSFLEALMQEKIILCFWGNDHSHTQTRTLNMHIFILTTMVFIDFPCNYAVLYLFAAGLCCAIY